MTTTDLDTSTARGPIVKSKVGRVLTDSMDKTILVRVDTFAQHPLYKKRIRRSKKFVVHDERNEAHAGDVVQIVEGRPRSKRKTWELASVVRSSRVPAVEDLPESEEHS
ncbi:MAG TPA: 30S ribosomal protein S17 [Chloroflexota bacterium]|nr:30S ribosomal protein S17 [Chloroflexota bacterium]